MTDPVTPTPELDFDNIYAKYVIREIPFGYFVGPDDNQYRVFLRGMAARFTRQGASDYIKSHPMKEPDGFLIEDAT